MKVHQYIASLACCMLVLSACTKKIDLDFPPHESMLVLNGIFNPDSLFSVELSSNRSIASNENFVPVQNAAVELYQDGIYLSKLQHSAKGVYKAPIKPERLKRYEIRVKAAGFPDIASRSFVPEQPLVREVKGSVFRDPNDPSPGLNVSLVLEDPPGEENFYSIRAYTFDKYYTGTIFIRELLVSFDSPIEEDFSRGYNKYFSDKLFPGKALNLKIYLANTGLQNTFLRIAQVSPEYYTYGKTYQAHHRTDININQSPVSNNIENGRGVFAGYNAITIAVKP